MEIKPIEDDYPNEISFVFEGYTILIYPAPSSGDLPLEPQTGIETNNGKKFEYQIFAGFIKNQIGVAISNYEQQKELNK